MFINFSYNIGHDIVSMQPPRTT